MVAIDEESYAPPPFRGSPIMTWTGEIGRVLGAIVDGGAKVVGFDIVIRDVDRAVRDSVRRRRCWAKESRFRSRFSARARARRIDRGKVVLGEILRGDQPIRPSAGQRIAVRQQQNIRPLNVYTDATTSSAGCR